PDAWLYLTRYLGLPQSAQCVVGWFQSRQQVSVGTNPTAYGGQRYPQLPEEGAQPLASSRFQCIHAAVHCARELLRLCQCPQTRCRYWTGRPERSPKPKKEERDRTDVLSAHLYSGI